MSHTKSSTFKLLMVDGEEMLVNLDVGLKKANNFLFQALTFLSFPILKWTRNIRRVNQKFCVDYSSPLFSSYSRPSSVCWSSASWHFQINSQTLKEQTKLGRCVQLPPDWVNMNLPTLWTSPSLRKTLHSLSAISVKAIKHIEFQRANWFLIWRHRNTR